MLQNLKTKAKLTILSFIALLAILILGILGTVQLKQVNNGLVRVYNDRVIPLEQLKIIADEYAVNIVDTTHQTRNGNFNFDKCVSNIDEAQTKIKSNLEKYLSTELTKEEKVLVDSLKSFVGKGDEVTNKIKQSCKNKDIDSITKITIEELYPNIDPISGKVSELIKL
ncbi:MCP four helix bundle domain-containing protein, partial [Aliarcobacter butzleri]